MIFLIRFMPGMLDHSCPAAMIIGGVINGPIIGVFSAGMLLSWVNSVGVLGGFLGSILISTWKATEGHLALYDLSYIWYSTIGASLTIILAMIVTIFTSQDLTKLDRRLLYPCVGKLARCLHGGCGRRMQGWWEAIGKGEEEKSFEMKILSLKM